MSERAKKIKKQKGIKIVGKIIATLAIIILIYTVGVVINKQMIKKLYKKDYSEYVSKYSKEYDVEENLIYALIKAESNFDVKAESHQNAKGLMQLMDSTAEQIANKCQIKLTEDNIFDPDININLGTQYIAALLKKYECMEVALAAYNAGIGNVDKWIKNGIIKPDGSDVENIPYKETNTYVRKIMRDYKVYKSLTK